MGNFKDFTCQHVQKGKDKSIYIYHLIARDLCICERCGYKLMKQVLEQDNIEKDIMTKKESQHTHHYGR